MDPQIEAIIADSTALLSRAVPAFEAQKKVAALEQSNGELLSKVAALEQQHESQVEIIKTAAERAADFFNSRGMLKVARQDFVDELRNNPESIFAFVQRFTDTLTQKEAGLPGDNQEGLQALDPIEAFVRS